MDPNRQKVDKPVKRLVRLSVLCGLVGPPFFGILLVSLTLLQTDFLRGLGWDPVSAPTFDWPSGLALGDYGWAMTAGFLLNGIFMMLFSLGLRHVLGGTLPGRTASALLLMAGMAMMGLAFTTDPTHRTTPATWHGTLHDLSFVLLGLALISAMIAFGFAFRQDASWKDLSGYTWLSAGLIVPSYALKGIAFYLFLGVMLAWSERIAFRLFRIAKR